MHVWPNAYKNDRTAFSDQFLDIGRTDFYFSKPEDHGYINKLNFKVNGINTKYVDHPEHQDIIRVVLPTPLVPHSSCTIETPFHVKLPLNFSRGGHIGQAYQITQWYPKPAVYDRKGWHPMPYLDQGEFYSEFGNYEVRITLPSNYVVAATGELQNEQEINWLKERSNKEFTYTKPVKQPAGSKAKIIAPSILAFPASSSELKTITYKQNNVHDFAWFADKRFIVKQDTLQLPSGRVINVFSYSLPSTTNYWKNSIQFIKRSVLTRSKWLGEYPYNVVSAVEAVMGFTGGMEYPTITSISPAESENDLESTIAHEIGHNWNQGILATNEREHAWMDEGINTFYEDRYMETESISTPIKKKETFGSKRMPADKRAFSLRNIIANKTDQPIETPSDQFTEINYYRMSYQKTAQWLKLLETTLGKDVFDSCMHVYYERWKFKHLYPEDLKKIFEEVSGKNLDNEFSLLSKKGPITNDNIKRKTKLASFYNFKDTDKYKYIFIAPAIGKNLYDGIMVGGIVHNYTLPAEKFQFFVSPLYGTESKQLNGLGRISYHWLPEKHFQKIEIGVNGSHFSDNHSLDTTGNKIFENFSKVVPFVRFNFKHTPKSSVTSYIDFRSFIIQDKKFDNFDYAAGSDSTQLYPKGFSTNTRYINQLTFNVNNDRVLYPYNYYLQLQQGDGFYRVNAEGNYFFNYAKGGGMSVRLFAAKFGYLGTKDFSTYIYQPKLLAGNGLDDYTYSDYFLGRTALSSYGDNALLKNGGLAAQQITTRNNGGLKLRMDPYGSVQGYSEDWILSVNALSSLPKEIIPAKLPLKVFLDAGTYAEAWGKNPPTNRFLYVAGLQLSLFRNILKINAPIIYSKAFKDQLKTDSEANKFSKKITFSIDIQNLQFKKLFPQFSF